MLLCFIRFFVLAFVLLLLSSPALAQEASGENNSSNTFWEFNRYNQPLFYAPYDYLGGDLAAWPIGWSYDRREWREGDYTLILERGAGSAAGPFLVGEPMYMDSMFGRFTYRYDGFLGGAVRPFARMTVGANQFYSPLAATGFQGFSTGGYAYAMPEAGVEFVYEGYGVGMTVSYPIPLGAFDQQANDITGPAMFSQQQMRRFEFDNLMKNIYLIIPPLIAIQQ